MKRDVTVETSDGKKYYKIEESGSKYYAYRDGSTIGTSRSLEDALSIIKSHATQYGRVYNVDLGSEQSDTTCFITTATLLHNGTTDDNCYELKRFRMFRDEYVALQPKGNIEIATYYQYAPTIVRAIENDIEKDNVYKAIWESLKKCLNWIEEGQNELAYCEYKKVVNLLKLKYLDK